MVPDIKPPCPLITQHQKLIFLNFAFCCNNYVVLFVSCQSQNHCRDRLNSCDIKTRWCKPSNPKALLLCFTNGGFRNLADLKKTKRKGFTYDIIIIIIAVNTGMCWYTPNTHLQEHNSHVHTTFIQLLSIHNMLYYSLLCVQLEAEHKLRHEMNTDD